VLIIIGGFAIYIDGGVDGSNIIECNARRGSVLIYTFNKCNNLSTFSLNIKGFILSEKQTRNILRII